MTKLASPNAHYRKCNVCEAMCGIIVEHSEGKVTSIRGNPKDPFSRGYHCIKAEALADIYSDPNRLKTPVKRTSTGWQPISWKRAFSEVTSELKKVQKKYGKNSVGLYLGNPNAHNYGTLLYGLGFARSLRTRNRFSATSVDQLPHMLAAYLMFGHQIIIAVPDVDRTDYMLMLGANPVVSRGSIMTAPDIGVRLTDLAKRGKLIVVDPRRTETAAIANEHVFIRPSADAAFLTGLIHIIFREKLEKPGRLLTLSEGYDELKNTFATLDLGKIEAMSGISLNKMEQIARDFSAAPSAVCYGRVGVSTQKYGGLCHWLISILNFITGNLDRAGGAMFTNPALDVVPGFSRGHFAKYHSRVKHLPEFAGELPVAAMADEMLTGGEGQIKAFITIAGNPVLSTPNGRKLDEALAGLDFMLAIDPYINETTRHANIILPPTVALEHDNYDVVFNTLSIRNTATYTQELFKRKPGTLDDWEILLELETRMRSVNLVQTLKLRLRNLFIKFLQPAGLLALGLRFGPHGSGLNPLGKGLTLKKLKKNPQGIDLGPLIPMLPGRIFHKNKKINLVPKPYLDDFLRLQNDIQRSHETGDEFLLIGRRALRSNNSWFHNYRRIVKGRSMCTAFLNPVDGQKRGIASGDKITVTSRTGSIEIPVVITDSVLKGVICIPHGYGHNRPGAKLDIAAEAPGVSVNDITDETWIDALSANAAVNGLPVQVARVSPVPHKH